MHAKNGKSILKPAENGDQTEKSVRRGLGTGDLELL